MSMFVPELLAPAGNLEKLKIAILYGATAVYLAGQKYSLRSGAENFHDDEIRLGCGFAHAHQAKVYVVLNAFLHDEDLDGLEEYVQQLSAWGVDGIIASDLGVVEIVKENSALPVHLSTQASCINNYSVALWKNLGIKRVIVGRETAIADAGLLKVESKLEMEMFVHGAMCSAYSGNCTISNYTAGRDSNRGGCVQSCRFEYSLSNSMTSTKSLATEGDGLPFMSSADLNGLRLLPEFITHRIDSLKIEGRMKSNLYVATTTMQYAKALRALQNNVNPTTAENQNFLNSRIDKTLAQAELELERVSHRKYTQASLISPAAKDSIYYGDRSCYKNSAYEIAGTIVEVKHDQTMTLLAQNPLSRADRLEFLTFTGETVDYDLKEMLDINHRPIDRAKSNTLVVLPHLPAIQSLNLARKLVSHSQNP